MPNDTDTTGSSSLLGSINRMLDASVTSGAGLDNLVTVLSLLCLFSIVNRGHTTNMPQQTQTAANSNPLHKLLGELTKGGGDSGAGGGLSPDTLMSLLPLLNNPQLKSKLNPGTMGSVLGLLNNLGGLGLGGGSNSQEKPKNETKSEPKMELPKQPAEAEAPAAQAATAQQAAPPKERSLPPQNGEDSEEADGKTYGRYLNWKNNF